MIYLTKRSTEEMWFEWGDNKYLGWLQNSNIRFSFFIYSRRGMLHICLVTFISFISYTKVHLFISCNKVQLTHSVIHSHLIHFTDHIPSHSHSTYLVLLMLHRISILLYLSFFKQPRLWKLGVSLDETIIRNIYCIIWSWIVMMLLFLATS